MVWLTCHLRNRPFEYQTSLHLSDPNCKQLPSKNFKTVPVHYFHEENHVAPSYRQSDWEKAENKQDGHIKPFETKIWNKIR